MMKEKIEGEGTVSFAMGSVAKKVFNFKIHSKQSQLEAEKMLANVKLKVAENRVKQDNATDKLAKGTMKRLATTVIRGTILK